MRRSAKRVAACAGTVALVTLTACAPASTSADFTDAGATDTVLAAGYAPGAPVDQAPAWNSAAKTLTANWTAVAGATSYNIVVSPAPPSGPSTLTVAAPATSVTFPVTDGVKYTVTVQSGNGFTSPFSAGQQVLTMTAPVGLAVTQACGSRLGFSFAAGAGNAAFKASIGAVSSDTLSPGIIQHAANLGGATLPLTVTPTSSTGLVGPAASVNWTVAPSSVHLPYTFTRAPAGIGIGSANGSALVSDDGRFAAVFGSDGNFVVYDCFTSPITIKGQTGTTGAAAMYFQGDGNLVIYNSSMTPMAYTETGSADPAGMWLGMQPDGNLVMYDRYLNVKWALSGNPRTTGPGSVFMH